MNHVPWAFASGVVVRGLGKRNAACSGRCGHKALSVTLGSQSIKSIERGEGGNGFPSCQCALGACEMRISGLSF